MTNAPDPHGGVRRVAPLPAVIAVAAALLVGALVVAPIALPALAAALVAGGWILLRSATSPRKRALAAALLTGGLVLAGVLLVLAVGVGASGSGTDVKTGPVQTVGP